MLIQSAAQMEIPARYNDSFEKERNSFMKVQKEQSLLFESAVAELTDVELAKVLGGQNASQSRCDDDGGDYDGVGNESFSDANTNNFNLPLNLNLL